MDDFKLISQRSPKGVYLACLNGGKNGMLEPSVLTGGKAVSYYLRRHRKVRINFTDDVACHG